MNISFSVAQFIYWGFNLIIKGNFLHDFYERVQHLAFIAFHLNCRGLLSSAIFNNELIRKRSNDVIM